MKTLIHIILIIVIISPVSIYGQVQPEVLYGSTGNDGNMYIYINPNTGASTNFAPSGLYGPVTEIQFDPTGTILYGTTGGGSSNLISINLSTGSESLIGNHSSGAINGLEFVGNTLFGVLFEGGPDPTMLVTVNILTAELTSVGFTGQGAIAGLAYDQTSNIMYGITTINSELVSISLVTGEATAIGSIGVANECRGLAFGPDGILYTATWDGNLISVNPATGTGILIGSAGITISGLAFPSPDPEYSSGQLYGSTGNEGLSIIKINESTGAGTYFASNGTYGPVTELEFDPTGNKIFATTGGGTSNLITIDPVTGVETLIGSHFPGSINGLEFIGGILYGIHWGPGGPGGYSVLVTIDTATADLDPMGSTGLGPMGGLAYDNAVGMLYGITVHGGPALLVSIDIENGDAIPIGPVGVASECRGLTFGPDGILYTSSLEPANLIAIDPVTGAGTIVGPTGTDWISALAYPNPVLYGSVGAEDDQFILIDPTTGEESFLATSGTYGPVSDIQMNPTGTALYGVTGGGTSNLISIDLITGAESLIGNYSLTANDRINGLEYARNALYGTYISGEGSNQPSSLVIINTTTAELTMVGPTGFGAITGLAFDKFTGTLYGITADNGPPDFQPELISLNLETGEATLIGSLGFSFDYISRGLTFGPGGVLYTALTGVNDSYLASVDPTTGVGTIIGPTSSEWISGLAYHYHPAVPLSDWAIYVGIFLIAVFIIIRFRKGMV